MQGVGMANRKSLFGLVKRECCNYESDKCLGIDLFSNKRFKEEGGVNTDFFMSSNEVKFSSEHSKHYYLYRVHNFDKDTQGGRFFVVRGTVVNNFELIPTQYRVRLLSDMGETERC